MRIKTDDILVVKHRIMLDINGWIPIFQDQALNSDNVIKYGARLQLNSIFWTTGPEMDTDCEFFFKELDNNNRESGFTSSNLQWLFNNGVLEKE